MIDVVIFSKDRAAQLDMLLRSMNKHAYGIWANIIYTATHPNFQRGYDVLSSVSGQDNIFISETHFRTQVLQTLHQLRKDHIMFLVDDNVFVNPFWPDVASSISKLDDDDLLCISCRMHPSATYCYTMDQSMNVPALKDGTWEWIGQDADWGYPMALDGHIFRRKEMIGLLERMPFENPNTMEAYLATCPPNRKKMLCFSSPKIVNVVMNRVQTAFYNRCGNSASPEFLNEQFLQGRRLDMDAYSEPQNSVHAEFDARFV